MGPISGTSKGVDMKFIKQLYSIIVVGNQKAIVGFVVAFLGTYLAVVGVSLDMTVGEALTSLCNGTITAIGVWFKANK